MATERQKEAARRNIAKARQAQSAGAHGEKVPRRSQGMSTADQNKLPGKFVFPEERKEPLTDARHVRNAIARFDQVEGGWADCLVRPRPWLASAPDRTGQLCLGHRRAALHTTPARLRVKLVLGGAASAFMRTQPATAPGRDVLGG